MRFFNALQVPPDIIFMALRRALKLSPAEAAAFPNSE